MFFWVLGYTVQILSAKYSVTLLQFFNFNFHIIMYFCDRFHDQYVSQYPPPSLYMDILKIY